MATIRGFCGTSPGRDNLNYSYADHAAMEQNMVTDRDGWCCHQLTVGNTVNPRSPSDPSFDDRAGDGDAGSGVNFFGGKLWREGNGSTESRSPIAEYGGVDG